MAGCESCRENRYDRQAREFGWALVGPAVGGRVGYRSYQHECGHLQDVITGNMRWGDVDCANCGESWTSKPSQIYLFRIDLFGNPLLKLGYSSNPTRRLRQQLGIAAEVKTSILRTVAIPTGHEAVVREKAAHAYMRHHHPHLIVPKAEYGDAINTRTEIYRLSASPILHRLISGIKRDVG